MDGDCVHEGFEPEVIVIVLALPAGGGDLPEFDFVCLDLILKFVSVTPSTQIEFAIPHNCPDLPGFWVLRDADAVLSFQLLFLSFLHALVADESVSLVAEGALAMHGERVAVGGDAEAELSLRRRARGAWSGGSISRAGAEKEEDEKETAEVGHE